MTFQKIQFDRQTPQTSLSRSIRISPKLNFQTNKKTQKGFTLIELMVVVSIIALLSTLVLAALGDARMKTRNTAKNALVLEYIKALELYRSDNNGNYPIATEISNYTEIICFGYSSNEKCFGDTWFGSNSIITMMTEYLPNNFAHKGPVQFGSSDLKGIQYVCKDTKCGSYELVWFLEKSGQKCIRGGTMSDDFTGLTKCTYP